MDVSGDLEEISLDDSPEKRSERALRRALSDEGKALFFDAHSPRDISREALSAFMRQHNPEKSGEAQIDHILNRYCGRHHYLREDLRAKYGAEVPGALPPPSSTLDRSRIIGMSAAPKLGPQKEEKKKRRSSCSLFSLGPSVVRQELRRSMATMVRGAKAHTTITAGDVRPQVQGMNAVQGRGSSVISFTIPNGEELGFHYSKSHDDEFQIQFDHFLHLGGRLMERIGGRLQPLYVLTHINKQSQKLVAFEEAEAALARERGNLELTFAYSAQNAHSGIPVVTGRAVVGRVY
jgi:hypothetical protein